MDGRTRYLIAARYKRCESAKSLAKEFGITAQEVIQIYEQVFKVKSK